MQGEGTYLESEGSRPAISHHSVTEACSNRAMWVDDRISWRYRLGPEYEKISSPAKFTNAFGMLEFGSPKKRSITSTMLEHVQFTGFSKSSGPTGE
jgi:hypothetical protein